MEAGVAFSGRPLVQRHSALCTPNRDYTEWGWEKPQRSSSI